MASSPHHCPFPLDRFGRPCPKPVLPSPKAFRRHLISHHNHRLAVGTRFGAQHRYIPLAAADVDRMRARQLCHRGGTAVELLENKWFWFGLVFELS